MSLSYVNIYTRCKLVLSFVFLLFIISCSNKSGKKDNTPKESNTGWVHLFNGKNLDGWNVLGGDGNFYVENNAIVGKAEKGIETSFLATKNSFKNFILKLDFKVDPKLNSGVQIRSHVYASDTTTSYLSGKLERKMRHWDAGKVHGYQVEIDPSDRAWTGGFYEEGGRGWLKTLKNKEKARNAFNPNEWNKFKIVAKGNHFTSYLNGIKAASMVDTLAKNGFIAFQIDKPGKEQIGQTVMFKNIRIKELK